MLPPSDHHPTQPDSNPTPESGQSSAYTPDEVEPTATNRELASKDRISEEVVRIPGYILQGELARGGMGVVYRAIDPSFDRNVAIKVLLPELSRVPEAAVRFAAEARISGKLQHPGVPPVHQLGTLADGRPFLVMKLIRGQTLASLIKTKYDDPHKSGPFDFIRIFEQICHAVGYAHQHGIVHRDLKPQNIMVGEFGEVQVMDWGLAKELRRSEQESPRSDSETTPDPLLGLNPRPPQSTIFEYTVTQPGDVLGTPAYMPPEQARGENERVDARADVFALGGILCAILTGQPPYAVRSGREAIRRAAAGELTHGFSLLDSCGADPDLITLAKECLSRYPPNRPANGGEVARRVSEYRRGLERRLRAAETDRVRAEVRAAEQSKRKRMQFALLAAVMLLVIGSGTFAWWQDRQSERSKLQQAEFEATQARSEGERIRQQAEAQRREQLERERLTRNAEAVEWLLDRAESALRTDRTDAASLAMDEAESRIREGGSEGLRTRFDRLKRDLQVLHRLDELDNQRWTSNGRRFLDAQADAALPEVFRHCGVDPNSTSPIDVAVRLEESTIRERVLMALERWYLVTRSRDVLAVLSAVDPDPFRNDVRNAIANRQVERVRELAALPAARSQPLRFVLILGNMPDISFPQRQDMLLDAHRRSPDNLSLLMSLALLYPIGQKPGATNRAGWFRAALAVKANLLSAWNGLGIALYDLDDLQGAIAAFRVATQLNPGYTAARSNLGIALNKSGDTDGAIAELREGLKLSPEDPALWYNLGIALADRRDYRDAVEALRKSISIDASDALAHFNLALVLEELSDPDSAIAAYQQAIRCDADLAAAHNNLGILLTDRKDYVGAAKAFREVVRIQPENPRAHHSLGDALWFLGDLDGAIDSYRTAIWLKPDYASAHFNLGMALGKRGNRVEANWELREAARLDPARFGHILKQLSPLELAPPPRPVER